MVHALRGLIVLQMTGFAICGCAGELIIHVTRRARHRSVFACQRESRKAVIEFRPLPLRGCMAGFALLGEA